LAQVALLRGVPINTLRLEPAETQGKVQEQKNALRSWRFTLASGAATQGEQR
jgi:hypothetical protein